MKYKRIPWKLCVICNALFEPNRSRKTCSDECSYANKLAAQRAKQRRYRKIDPEASRAKQRDWRTRNIEHARAYDSAWKREHRRRVNASQAT